MLDNPQIMKEVDLFIDRYTITELISDLPKDHQRGELLKVVPYLAPLYKSLLVMY